MTECVLSGGRIACWRAWRPYAVPSRRRDSEKANARASIGDGSRPSGCQAVHLHVCLVWEGSGTEETRGTRIAAITQVSNSGERISQIFSVP